MITQPLCPVFGICGGCTYQDVSYDTECHLKTEFVRDLLKSRLGLEPGQVEAMVASPKPYHYRSRLDLSFRRTKKGETFLGFMPERRFHVIPIESCAIAMEPISESLPSVKQKAMSALPSGTRLANLVIKTGDDGRVFWGGIGRGSLHLEEKDYLWTNVCGRKIFYSLDTFFQANLSILPILMERVERLIRWDGVSLFCDLYSGVGLFGIYFASMVDRVFMVEENPASLKLAHYNIAFHRLQNIEVHGGKVEDELPGLSDSIDMTQAVLCVDPPRKGLSPRVCDQISRNPASLLLYLSCQPESLVKDLVFFLKKGWRVDAVIPFDFFPKTKHIEILTLLKRA